MVAASSGGNIHVSTVSIDEKSFSQYSGPALPFNQYNIVFGLNGHGKSTLASNIYSTALAGSIADDDIRIYNARYIENTLLLEDEPGKINSVKANFGKKNTDIEEQVAILNAEISELKEQLNGVGETKGLVTQQRDSLEDMQTEVKGIHNALKGKTTVKLKFSDTNNPFELKILDVYAADHAAGLKLFSQEVIEKSSGNDDYEADLERINDIKLESVTDTNVLTEIELDVTEKTLKKTYSGSTPNSDELDWLIEGLSLHGDDETCKFCLNHANMPEIKKRIEAYQEDTKVTDMTMLKGIMSKASAYKICGETLLSLKSSYRELFEKEEDFTEAFENLKMNIIIVDELIEHIQRKLKDNNSVELISADFHYTALLSIENICEELQTLKQTKAAEVTDLINRQNTLVKARIGYDISQSEIIASKKADYVKLSKDVEKINGEIIEKQGEIDKLKSQKSEIANFADYVNGVLESMGFDFRLIPDKEDKSYELRHRNNVAVSITDISEGERNLLALLYFHFEMLHDDEKTLKSNIKLIIIDDPIASLDDDNRFYILETIKSLLDDQTVQVFVFTHLWDSFCDLAFGKNGNPKTNLYEVIKNNSVSDVIRSNTQEQPYRRMYADIWQFSQTNIGDVDDDTFLHMPNTMRRVFEDYMRFYAGIKNVTSNAKEEVAKALLNEEYAQLGTKEKLRLNTLLSVTNILSHRIPGGPSRKEIHDSAKFFMNRMGTHHKRHHDTMKVVSGTV